MLKRCIHELITQIELTALGSIQDSHDKGVMMRQNDVQTALVLIRPTENGKCSQFAWVHGRTRLRTRGSMTAEATTITLPSTLNSEVIHAPVK